MRAVLAKGPQKVGHLCTRAGKMVMWTLKLITGGVDETGSYIEKLFNIIFVPANCSFVSHCYKLNKLKDISEYLNLNTLICRYC